MTEPAPKTLRAIKPRAIFCTGFSNSLIARSPGVVLPDYN
jgi:hypothetical protein